MKTHHLKTIQPFFDEILSGDKQFELRKNDRDFKAGDTAWLEEYDSKLDAYSGRKIRCTICYVLTDFPGLQKEYCIFAFSSIKHPEQRIPLPMKEASWSIIALEIFATFAIVIAIISFVVLFKTIL